MIRVTTRTIKLRVAALGRLRTTVLEAAFPNSELSVLSCSHLAPHILTEVESLWLRPTWPLGSLG